MNMTFLPMTKSDIKEGKRVIKIHVAEAEDNYFALITAKKFAIEMGFSIVEATLIATVVSELSTNIIRYAGEGDIFLKKIENKNKSGIELKAIDEGPGINDVEKAMRDSYTTTKNSLGLGLPSLKRIMDEFNIESGINTGTRIVGIKWMK